MEKKDIEIKIKELEELKIKIENKRKEVDSELIGLRYQLYAILEKEESEKPSPDTSFLNDEEWSGFA